MSSQNSHTDFLPSTITRTTEKNTSEYSGITFHHIDDIFSRIYDAVMPWARNQMDSSYKRRVTRTKDKSVQNTSMLVRTTSFLEASLNYSLYIRAAQRLLLFSRDSPRRRSGWNVAVMSRSLFLNFDIS